MISIQRVYAITFRDRFLKKLGLRWRGGGFEWVDDLADARLYASEEALNKHLLQVARACPDGGPWPEVVELEVARTRVIDCRERFEKNRARANKAEATRNAGLMKRRADRVDADVARLREELRAAEERAARCKPATP